MKTINHVTMTINYASTVTAQGRNGAMKQTGIWIYRYDDRISIHPLTSKGKPGNCAIEIPNASLFTVANAIEPLRESDTLREALENLLEMLEPLNKVGSYHIGSATIKAIQEAREIIKAN